MSNPKVFFNISTNKGDRLGRVVIELFVDTHPRTADNFRILLTGHHYKGSGLIFDGDTYSFGGYSFCQPVLDLSDEHFVIENYGKSPGAVTMLPDRVRFYIFPSKAPVHPHMVVGRVVEGLDVINTANMSDYGVVISDCGQLPEPKVSERPREELAGMVSSSNKHLSDIQKEIEKVKEQVIGVNAERFRKQRLGELEEMANYVRQNVEVLNGLEGDVTSMKEHQSELLAEMDVKISKWKEGKVILEAIRSLPDEVLDDIESAIKKLKSDRFQ